MKAAGEGVAHLLASSSGMQSLSGISTTFSTCRLAMAWGEQARRQCESIRRGKADPATEDTTSNWKANQRLEA